MFISANVLNPLVAHITSACLGCSWFIMGGVCGCRNPCGQASPCCPSNQAAGVLLPSPSSHAAIAGTAPLMPSTGDPMVTLAFSDAARTWSGAVPPRAPSQRDLHVSSDPNWTAKSSVATAMGSLQVNGWPSEAQVNPYADPRQSSSHVPNPQQSANSSVVTNMGALQLNPSAHGFPVGYVPTTVVSPTASKMGAVETMRSLRNSMGLLPPTDTIHSGPIHRTSYKESDFAGVSAMSAPGYHEVYNQAHPVDYTMCCSWCYSSQPTRVFS